MEWALCSRVGKTLVNPDGTVRSLNPSSLTRPYSPYTWGSRPPGTEQEYERCEVQGGMVVYNPTQREAVVFGFVATVPNCAYSAISVEPLK